eukprot:scaffold114599_cov67-Phaeocystis_antarctica.AAC.2
MTPLETRGGSGGRRCWLRGWLGGWLGSSAETRSRSWAERATCSRSSTRRAKRLPQREPAAAAAARRRTGRHSRSSRSGVGGSARVPTLCAELSSCVTLQRSCSSTHTSSARARW